MSSSESATPLFAVRPRPGVVKALGIANIVFSVMLSLCLFSSVFWLILASGRSKSVASSAKITTVVAVGGNTPATTSAAPRTFAIDPFIGMNDPNFNRFAIVDTATALLLNGLMFATGIGLLNMKSWGARWWTYLAWTKIVRLALFWGFFIVAIAPGFAETMAKGVVQMFQAQGGLGRRTPTVGEFTRVYSVMNLILGVGMIVMGSIYPAVSLWLMSRPGFKAALIDRSPSEEPAKP